MKPKYIEWSDLEKEHSMVSFSLKHYGDYKGRTYKCLDCGMLFYKHIRGVSQIMQWSTGTSMCKIEMSCKEFRMNNVLK